MGILKAFSSLLNRPEKGGKQAAAPGDSSAAGAGRGILVFDETGQVIRAEAALKAQGFKLAVKAPPPALRTGCDLVIEFELLRSPAALSVLSAPGIRPRDVLAVTGELLEPVSVFQHKDFGDYFMVRAANMKITVEKKSGLIVNVSGGGCPDVPCLAARLVGKRLDEAAPPLDSGQTLCGYALQLAFDEARRCAG